MHFAAFRKWNDTLQGLKLQLRDEIVCGCPSPAGRGVSCEVSDLCVPLRSKKNKDKPRNQKIACLTLKWNKTSIFSSVFKSS